VKSKALIWKELLDLSRDKRTLAVMIIIPFIGLPAMALVTTGLSSTQTTTVYIEVLDNKSLYIAKFISSQVMELSGQYGLRVNVTISNGPPKSIYNILLVIPKGFYKNITYINGIGTLYLKSLVGSVQSSEVKSIIENVIGEVKESVVVNRVKILANRSGINATPYNVLNPISISSGYYLPSGSPAPVSQVKLSYTARLLEFSLFFVANPAIILMGDSVLGEKERKTIETLLATPASKTSIIIGKLSASVAIGLVTAIADSAGVILYLSMISPGSLKLTPGLIGVNLAVSALLVIMSAAIITPAILRSSSIRSAQSVSYLLMMVALGIYFSALFIDFQRLPYYVQGILMVIPFTQAALALQNFVLGQYVLMVTNLVIMAGFILLGIFISIKSFNTERLILSK